MTVFWCVLAGAATLFALAWLSDPKGPIHDEDGCGPFDFDGDDL
jgi:hypothetical protein